ncbi:MAG TPA: glycosyl hydrolase family 18 protein [Acidobacteriaceae bacterium]|nr:glycosyl hydrolase family 18 protein [Acidobacteriaceae bacterium]
MRILRVFLLFALGASVLQAQPKALFYMINSPQSIQSFLDHADKIDILVPTWYATDVHGLVWGGPNPQVMRVAREHHVAVMPILSGSDMGTEEYHQIFNDAAARKAMEDALVLACKQNGYLGIQFDFEDISWQDSAALSKTVAETAAALHSAGFQLSIATVPNAPGHALDTAYNGWMFRDWRGAYDLKTLAQSADLICLMTYDQHTRFTPPGPVAGYPWVMENLKYALAVVPKDKLSLGIAVYGYHWFAGPPPGGKNTPNIDAEDVSAPAAMQLAQAYGAKPQWDPVDKTAWFYFYRAQDREWVFYTDVKTFAARYDLVKQYGLQGFCSWVLGEEDPGIWALLPSHGPAVSQATIQRPKREQNN